MKISKHNIKIWFFILPFGLLPIYSFDMENPKEPEPPKTPKVETIEVEPEQIVETIIETVEIKKEIPEFEISYEPDFRQAIADSWPASIDDSKAIDDWGLSYDFDITTMTREMLENLKIKLKK